jgi:ketosteroid isomerase-like protein
MPQSGSTEQDVVEAAHNRAVALVAGDENALRRLMHPELRWTTLKGGRDHTFRVRLTQTWVRTAGGWRCLAGHASAPAG